MDVKYLIMAKTHGGRRKLHSWKNSITAGPRQRLVEFMSVSKLAAFMSCFRNCMELLNLHLQFLVNAKILV